MAASRPRLRETPCQRQRSQSAAVPPPDQPAPVLCDLGFRVDLIQESAHKGVNVEPTFALRLASISSSEVPGGHGGAD